MIQKELKQLIDKYCMGVVPTDAQQDEIFDMVKELGADPQEVAHYMEIMQDGPTREEIEKQEAEEREKRRAQREAQERAKQEARRKAEQEAISSYHKDDDEQDEYAKFWNFIYKFLRIHKVADGNYEKVPKWGLLVIFTGLIIVDLIFLKFIIQILLLVFFNYH